MFRCSYKELENFKKNVFMIYAYVIHTCLDVALATKLENYKKNVFMIYALIICCINGRGSTPFCDF